MCAHTSLSHTRRTFLSLSLWKLPFSEFVYTLVVKLVGFCRRVSVELARHEEEGEEPFGNDVVDPGIAPAQQIDWERFEVDSSIDDTHWDLQESSSAETSTTSATTTTTNNNNNNNNNNK